MQARARGNGRPALRAGAAPAASGDAMGCGVSFTARRAANALPAGKDGVIVRESYEKVMMSPGGTITKALGYCIDTRLPAKTPGGSVAARRDYDRDPLTFEEVLAIEAARERARYLAGTPKMLASNWRRIVLQAPTASTPAPTDDADETGEAERSAGSTSNDGADSTRTGSGRREIQLKLPSDCSGGEELVIETPRGTLVDVTVPASIAPVPPGETRRTIAVRYHPNLHAAIPTPTTPVTPILLSSPPKSKKKREGS